MINIYMRLKFKDSSVEDKNRWMFNSLGSKYLYRAVFCESKFPL